MDKKKKISWGVSFGSLALVAGMVSYLGLTNGYSSNSQTTLNQGQGQASTNSNQPQGNSNLQQGQGPTQGISGKQSSQYNQQSPTNNNGSFFGNDQQDSSAYNSDQLDGSYYSNDQQSGQFSSGGPSFGHHGGFDTTTGGT
ncbi:MULTISPECIES: hypothetical protein [Bacillaceae]|uniref:hypothetical protein n=1 Tax=Bacillaceae TaxID=186817 RepID=UPI002FFDC0AB